MPMTDNDLANAEFRVAELTKKIALRESQQNLPAGGGDTYGRDPVRHIEPLRYELRQAAAVVVAMKYDPLEVIKRMSAPPPAPVAPTPVLEPRQPTADEVRAELRRILSAIPDNATVASVRELFK